MRLWCACNVSLCWRFIRGAWFLVSKFVVKSLTVWKFRLYFLPPRIISNPKGKLLYDYLRVEVIFFLPAPPYAQRRNWYWENFQVLGLVVHLPPGTYSGASTIISILKEGRGRELRQINRWAKYYLCKLCFVLVATVAFLRQAIVQCLLLGYLI